MAAVLKHSEIPANTEGSVRAKSLYSGYSRQYKSHFKFCQTFDGED